MAVFETPNVGRKKVPGFGGKYEVTERGEVLSRGCVLEPVRGMYVNLSGKDGVRQVKIAYLVARAFIPNLEARPYVVHKNGDRRDNRVENLQWSETREARRGRKPEGGLGVVVMTPSGEFVGTYPSVRTACDVLRMDYSAALRVLKGRARTTKGYVLRWA